MEISALEQSGASAGAADACLVVPAYENEFPLKSLAMPEGAAAVLQSLADQQVLTGKAQSCYYLPTPLDQVKGVLVLGLGAREKCAAETVRRAAGVAAGLLKQHKMQKVCLDLVQFPELPPAAFVEGVMLGQYTFDVYKKNGDEPRPDGAVRELVLLLGQGRDTEAAVSGARRAAMIAVGVNSARQLANTAANDLTPAVLAEMAERMLGENGCACTVLDENEMAGLGMNALLGVAKGADNPPRLILAEYRHPEASRTVVVAGKGVCFDSGGLSIKPAQNMHEMKFDMCGAAAALAALMTAAQLAPKLNIIAVVSAVENKTGSRAQTPGDIVRACNGKTIEVQNTDAEGRLILADAMAYAAEKYKPDMMVDLATLTGACVVALGHTAAGVMGTDDALVDALIQAGEETGDRLWKFPLWEDYQKMIEGEHADLCNIGPGREAGAIMGGVFLRHFTGGVPWAHIDIAGVSYGVKNAPHLPAKYATGFGVRLLLRWFDAVAGETA